MESDEKATYAYPVVFPLADCDLNNRPFIYSYLQAFQEAGSAHVDSIGYGYYDLIKLNLIWVVVKMKIQIIKNPADKKLVLFTWPHPKSLMHFDRDFSLMDQEGNTYVNATSQWVILNSQTRRMVRPPHDYPFSNFNPKIALPADYEAISKFETGSLSPTLVKKVAYTDIDHNQHANNAKLCSFLLDSVPGIQDREIETIQIDFKNEARLGDEIKGYCLKSGENQANVSLFSGDKEITSAIIGFKNI